MAMTRKQQPRETTPASDVEDEMNRLAADRMAADVIEGFRELAREKASLRVSDQLDSERAARSRFTLE